MLSVTTTAWPDGGEVPPKNAYRGENKSPAFEFHWSKGLPSNLLIFHTGLCLSASSVDNRRHRNRLVSFRSGSYEIGRQFNTFDEWYQQTIRAEYAERYGLTSG